MTVPASLGARPRAGFVDGVERPAPWRVRVRELGDGTARVQVHAADGTVVACSRPYPDADAADQAWQTAAGDPVGGLGDVAPTSHSGPGEGAGVGFVASVLWRSGLELVSVPVDTRRRAELLTARLGTHGTFAA